MKRLAILAVVAAALLAPAAASAHPLGNFTINRFSRLEVSGHRIYVRYVLDMAEIPTFQAGHIDAHAYAQRIARNAQLVVGGRAAELNNYKDRIGWKEIVVGPKTRSTSDELRAYPKDLLQSPLDITSVSTQLAPRDAPDVPPALSTGKTLQAPDRVADAGFSSLVGRHHLSALVILASLGAAFFWGMAHALSPGHGKTIVAAYLVGRRGTPWHAAALGVIVTATHTIGVFALGLVTLALSQFIVPDQLYPWLNLVSGVLVIAIGAAVFRSRFRHRRGHAHGHHHHHHEDEALSRRSLVAVGITGGLLPCPSALVVLLAAISLHRVPFGMLLIVAFSAGLALSITGIGLVAVFAKQIFKRASFEGRLVRLLPAASALVILAAGLAMTVRALPKVS